jgi:pimeloyl-ACP methyl ester carboxylesterase
MMAAEDIDLQHIAFRASGVELHAVAPGSGDGRLVILLHGFPEFWYGFRRQIAPLASAGFRVIVPDQRGYAGSSKPHGIDAYGFDTLAADVAAIADSCSAEKFDLVGHDFGGVVAWWVALKFPNRVRRLVVINAPHPVAGRRYAKQHWRQLLRSWYIFFFQIPGLPDWFLARRGFALLRLALTGSARRGLFTEDDLRNYREAWAAPGALTAMLNWYRALRRFRARGTDLKVRQPTLLLWGDHDLYLDAGLAEASLAYCAAGRLRRFPDASHWLQHEEADVVSQEIREFLSGR